MGETPRHPLRQILDRVASEAAYLPMLLALGPGAIELGSSISVYLKSFGRYWHFVFIGPAGEQVIPQNHFPLDVDVCDS